MPPHGIRRRQLLRLRRRRRPPVVVLVLVLAGGVRAVPIAIIVAVVAGALHRATLCLRLLAMGRSLTDFSPHLRLTGSCKANYVLTQPPGSSRRARADGPEAPKNGWLLRSLSFLAHTFSCRLHAAAAAANSTAACRYSIGMPCSPAMRGGFQMMR